jgi:hypothetical protein
MSHDNIEEVLEAIAAAEITAGQSRSLEMAFSLQEYREKAVRTNKRVRFQKLNGDYREREGTGQH